jgi:hypothetical protein
MFRVEDGATEAGKLLYGASSSSSSSSSSTSKLIPADERNF